MVRDMYPNPGLPVGGGGRATGPDLAWGGGHLVRVSLLPSPSHPSSTLLCPTDQI